VSGASHTPTSPPPTYSELQRRILARIACRKQSASSITAQDLVSVCDDARMTQSPSGGNVVSVSPASLPQQVVTAAR